MGYLAFMDMTEQLCFTFFSSQDNRLDTVKLAVSDTGWILEHPRHRGPVAPNGEPLLRTCVEAAGVKYPSGLSDAMEEIWQAATTERLSKQEIQARLDGFSEWMQYLNTAQIF